MMKTVVADNSGNVYDFKGIVKEEAVDKLFDSLKFSAENWSGGIDCSLNDGRMKNYKGVGKLDPVIDAMKTGLAEKIFCTLKNEVLDFVTVEKNDGDFNVELKGDSSSFNPGIEFKDVDIGIEVIPAERFMEHAEPSDWKDEKGSSEVTISAGGKTIPITFDVLKKIKDKLGDVPSAHGRKYWGSTRLE